MQALWVLIATLFSSLSYAAIKASGEGFAFYEIYLVRSVYLFVSTALLTIPFRTTLVTKHPQLHVLRCLAGILATSLNIIAIQHIPLATAQTLFNTAPLFVCLWVMVTSTRELHRKDFWLITSVATGFLGVFLVLRPSFASDAFVFVMTGLSAGVVFAVVQICLKNLGLRKEPVVRTAFYFSLSGLIFSSVLTAALSEKSLVSIFLNPTMFLVGIFTVVAQLAQTRGWGKGKTLLCANLQFSLILFSIFFGWFFFAETLNEVTGIGILIILASEISAVWIQQNRKS